MLQTLLDRETRQASPKLGSENASGESEENREKKSVLIAQLIICLSTFQVVTSEFDCFPSQVFFPLGWFDLFTLFSSRFCSARCRKRQIERSDDGLNVLHLLNVDHKISGEVKCRVACRNNPQIFNVYHTSLTVLPLPISERYGSIENVVADTSSNKSSLVDDLTAYITKRPDDQTVLVGDSIQLNVEYVGVPEPTVRWMRAVSVNWMFSPKIQSLSAEPDIQFSSVYIHLKEANNMQLVQTWTALD